MPAKFEKWIDGIDRGDLVGRAAQHSLEVRLSAVQYFLPLAAGHAEEDIEYVHELRVYTRRSMAALKLYSEVVPKKEAKWFRKTLRRIRRAAGQARDLDMLSKLHGQGGGKGAKAFRVSVKNRRQAAQKPIDSIHKKLTRRDRFSRHLDKLLAKMGERSTVTEPFGRWASSRLRRILERFFEESPNDLADLASLHRFRIRGKQLRYAIELLAPAFSGEIRRDLYPIIEQLQERLGQINDRVVARASFDNWSDKATSKSEAKYLRKLLEQERVKQHQLLDDFKSWWAPRFAEELRGSFERLIDEQNDSPVARRADTKLHSPVTRSS